MEVFVDGRMVGARLHVAHRISGAGYGLNRIHGHTYEVRVKLIGRDTAEFLFPFERLAEIMYECIKPLNNKILLAEKGGNVAKFEGEEIIYITADNKRYAFPKEDVYFLPLNEVTAEALAAHLLQEIAKMLMKERNNIYNIEAVELILWEGSERGVVIKKALEGKL